VDNYVKFMLVKGAVIVVLAFFFGIYKGFISKRTAALDRQEEGTLQERW
jgi:hypothetical protein